MPKKRDSRIYWRATGKTRRAYGDFRDLGGGRERLVAPGERAATTDPDVAAALAAARIRELEQQRRNRTLLGVERDTTLGSYVERHLVLKAEAARVTDQWIEQTQVRLDRAIAFFGGDRSLATLTTRDVQAWLASLRRERPRGRALSDGTLRHHLNSLSNLLRRAQSEGIVQQNAAAMLLEKPRGGPSSTGFLEVHEAALLLESARTWKPDSDAGAVSFIYPLLAAFLLTGGRKAEVCGLAVEDVSFSKATVTFRPSPYRPRLKTAQSARVVPLWPQLREIWQEYIFGGPGPLGPLLFPASRVALVKPVVDFRRALDNVAVRAGWRRGEIRSRMFRTTYTAARLQGLDNGAPVAAWTVARELGHTSLAMIEQVYGRLGNQRWRVEGVEYRVENHPEQLRGRLGVLQAK